MTIIKGKIDAKAPTDEQMAVINSRATTLSINAGAGCGKSFVLKEYAKARPKEKFLCLAYNKSTKQEAEQKFADLKNVVCMTTHGIAHASVGAKYKGKSKSEFDNGKIGENSPFDLCKVLHCSPREAVSAQKTVAKFLSSSMVSIGEECLDDSTYKSGVDDAKRMRVLELARVLWGRMEEPTDEKVKISLDGILKVYCLGIKDYRFEYDAILLDEAQDTSDAVCGMIDGMGLRRILAGDTHQSINGWRGAVNAMEKFKSEERLYLTSSYRFGPGIAGVANKILCAKGEKNLLTGRGVPGSPSGPLAIICRTNARVLDNSIKIASMGKKIHFIGGFGSYRFGKVLDVCKVAYGASGSCADPFIRSFESIEEIEIHAKTCLDVEMLQIIRFVKKHGMNVSKMIQAVRESEAKEAKHADVIICTAHNSKGLEFDNVVLDEDFYDMCKYSIGEPSNVQEEVNLIYVACTRAKKKLNTSKQLGAWLQKVSA